MWDVLQPTVAGPGLASTSPHESSEAPRPVNGGAASDGLEDDGGESAMRRESLWGTESHWCRGWSHKDNSTSHCLLERGDESKGVMGCEGLPGIR